MTTPTSRWDYVSPGLRPVRLDDSFPNMIAMDPGISDWPWLRREIPHTLYMDQRSPGVGFLNRDEAHILYNTALSVAGRPALEIGCYLGWSATHLGLAGVRLDVVDPLLVHPFFQDSVRASLASAGVSDRVTLIADRSPQAVTELARTTGKRWSLIFIDGDHEAPAPLDDAKACEQLAAPDAFVLFHDLASPDVAQGLEYFRSRGWRTKIYHTMQIMGVAWRGDIQPAGHTPDPRVTWTLPDHLAAYRDQPA